MTGTDQRSSALALPALIDDTAAATGFSGVVRVSTSDGEVVEAAFGLADRSTGRANTADTRFGIASGGKLLTALGAGVLVDEGRLAMGDRVTEIVAHDLPNVDGAVTVDQLLTHTSGVYDYYDEEADGDFDNVELSIPPFKLTTLASYLPMLTAGAMKFSPGARFSYSNGGYVLLGLAVEAASKTPYHRFIEERVLAPCGMSDSGFFRFDQLPDRVATGYIDEGDRWRSNIYMLPIIGGADGGVFSTAGDVERLWRAFLGGRVLSSELVETYRRPHGRYKDGIFYGRGLWVRDRDSGRRSDLYVEGCDAGVSFKSTYYGHGAIATVMSNTTDGAWPMAAALDRHAARDAAERHAARDAAERHAARDAAERHD